MEREERDERVERDELEHRAHSRKRLVWGFFLMALGSGFLLDRLHIVEMPSIGRMWPAIFLVIAAIHVVEGRLGGAVTWVVLSAWFFACEFGWYGLDYRNSWPLVLVAVGMGIVVRALRGEPWRRRWREGGGS
jgi:cell wall-active antibiotic response 4TMS protein YvqF